MYITYCDLSEIYNEENRLCNNHFRRKDFYPATCYGSPIFFIC